MGEVADENDLVEFIIRELDQLPEKNQHQVVRRLAERYHVPYGSRTYTPPYVIE